MHSLELEENDVNSSAHFLGNFQKVNILFRIETGGTMYHSHKVCPPPPLKSYVLDDFLAGSSHFLESTWLAGNCSEPLNSLAK